MADPALALRLPAALETQLLVDRFNAAYAAALDAGNYEAWIGMFRPDCLYKVIPRENHDAGLPLCTMALEGQGMLRDRVYGISNTLFHAPYYQRHVIGPALVHEDDGREIRAEANYAVFRTKPGSVSEVYNVGRYLDRLVREDGNLLLQERLCVFDSELILNSLIYPI
ncbi:aromatic-ring-hydroxylating dioxygenase subunit beta [Ferrovibrio sp.]|uniref:aromatic-ring-hydroxylating dioxygenase subunit beta n=1 Tax=Ferrovibrio sp. TaxID=1917215 RepID=UPI00311FA3B8